MRLPTTRPRPLLPTHRPSCRVDLLAVTLLLLAALVRCDCGALTVGADSGSGPTRDAAAGDATVLDAAAQDSGPTDRLRADQSAGEGALTDHAAPERSSADADLRDASADAAAGSDATAGDALTVDRTTADSSGPDAVLADAARPDTALADAPSPDAAVCGDACPAGATVCHRCVDILIDNFCHVSIVPGAIDVAPDVTLRLTFHNHSVDYAADVWSSSGYGYIELPTGWSWEDPINHCAGPTSYTEYFDIGIYGGGGSTCPDQRLLIHCS